MSLPRIEITPLRPAVRSDTSVPLDVLIRITPPTSYTPLQRPALNLGLVLDRSGSMAAQDKIGSRGGRLAVGSSCRPTGSA